MFIPLINNATILAYTKKILKDAEANFWVGSLTLFHRLKKHDNTNGSDNANNVEVVSVMIL